ncbi:MAG: hypothetical protein ACTHNP_00890 [Solirubrobacterales bacterium]
MRNAALLILALALTAAPACLATVSFPSHTSLEASSSGISGKITSPNPRCRTHRTLRLTLRALEEEESKLDFHDRVVHTGRRSTWHLSTAMPTGRFTLEVSLEAKSLAKGQGAHICLGDFHERLFNLSH